MRRRRLDAALRVGPAPAGVAAYRRDQAGLRERLAGIASGDTARREIIAAQAREMLSTVPTRLDLVNHRLVFGYAVPGIGAACWLAIALLLDEGRGLTNRLGQCRKPGCARSNLTFVGRPRIFCNDAHREAYDRIVAKNRVRAWRRRKKRKET